MHSPVLEAVRAIGPEVSALSDEIEANRTLPASVVDLVRPTGAFRMYTPADLGGPEVPAWVSLEVLEELGYHDGATGWCAMIGSTTSLMASYLPDPHAKEIFGSPDAIAGGFAMPRGTATPVDGGLRVSGTWQWGSGTRHCTWVGGGAWVVDGDGNRAPREDGLIVPFVFVPADAVDHVDNWHVMGLEGTGSGDYTMTDVFVPEGRWVQMGIDAPVRTNNLSRFSFYGLLASGVAAVALGVGRRSLTEFLDLAATKRPQGSRRTLSERSEVQSEVARSEARLDAARALLRTTIDEVWDMAERGETPTVAHKRRIRLAATHATQTAAEVTEALYKAAGGAAVYRTSRLQRCFRDAHVATQHAMVAPLQYQTAGRLTFGLDTDTTTL